MAAELPSVNAAQAAASAVSKVDLISLPEFGRAATTARDINKYRVRYCKIDLDDVGSITELELLETKSLKGEDIVILNKDKFTFMDKYMLVVTYLEYVQGPANA